MKKLISIILLLFLPLAAMAQSNQEILKASTAFPLGPIVIIDSSNHISGLTGCSSPTLKKISKGFGSAVTPSGTWTELDSTNFPGTYYITGNATDTGTDGPILAEIHCSGADPFTGVVGVVVDFNPRSVPTLTDEAAAILDALCSAHTTSSTIGKAVCDVDTHTDTEVAAIKAKTDGLTFSVSNEVDSNVIGGALLIRTGTAQAGGGSTITLDSGASATDELYDGENVVITSGTGAGQTRTIKSYVGSTKVATVKTAWATNPSSSSVFAVLPNSDPPLQTITKGVAFPNLSVWMHAADGTAVTGLSTSDIVCKVSKDGGSFATTTDTTETEVGLGKYVVDLSATEAAANDLSMICTGTGAVDYIADFITGK